MKLHRDQRKGFTLAELLAVLGIIAIMLAVAIPSLILHQRDLKLTELDDNARAVFMAAQNHLTALRSASAGERMDVSAAAGRGALAVPADAVDGLESGTELMYVSTNVSGADPDWLVLPGSIESSLSSEDSCYLVEFDPASGAVYGVFFMERSGARVLDESVYAQLYSYVSSSGASCRIREGRNAFARSSGGFPVGYYGADGALDVIRPDSLKLPTPKLKLINAEELVLEISTDPASWPASIDQSKLYISVSVTDATGAAGKTLVKKGAIQSGATARVVLDTLKTSLYDRGDTQTTSGWRVGGSFAQWMSLPGGGYTITPGADVSVTVSIWYQPSGGEGLVALPQSACVTTNSLFAARSGEQVEIAYGRHLQNLGAEGLDSAITSAVQTREIDFAKTKPAGASDVYYWAETYNHAGWPFVPVDNPALDSYNGMGLPIRGLNAVKTEGSYENAGLFARYQGSLLQKVVLVDAYAAADECAGALAGAAKGTTVDGCQVYITSADDGAYSTDARIAADTAGGLIGTATNCAIQGGSFASTVVNGSTVSGGLVGDGSDITVERSYAAGRLSGRTVGGLVGSGSSVSISNSYAAGVIAQATYAAGGLSAGAANVDRAYAAVDYVTVPETRVYGAVPSGTHSSAFYLSKSGVNAGGVGTAVSAADDMKLAKTLSGLRTAAGEETVFAEGGDADAPAYPYNQPNQPDGAREPTLAAPYPYPTLAGLDHYGDWLSSDGGSFLTYYEKYADGAYGFCFEKQANGATETVDTLRGGASDVAVEDGYGVLAAAAPSVSASGVSVAATQADGVEYAMDGKALGLYTLDGAWILNNHGYLQVSVDGQSVWVDPDFAKTVSLTQKTNSETAYTVRTVRQLDNIDLDLYASADKVFTQELTIDGGAYVGAVYGKTAGDWRPISAQYAAAPFSATFDGARDKGFMIRDLTVTGEQNAGLFAQIGPGATVRNVALASVNVSSTTWGDVNVGGLAGLISGGTVTNSGVFVADASGETLGADYDAYLIASTDWCTGANSGGFAGAITGGEVSKCFAAVKVKGHGNSGGFVGALSGGTVSDCYAAGHTVGGVFPVPGGDVRANVSTGECKAGGFVANWTGGGITGTCYATVSVEAQWSSSASVGAFAAVYPAGANLPGCYARSYVYQNGAQVNPTDVDNLGLDTSAYTGAKAAAHPYDDAIGTEYDFKPIDGLDHYGDWSLKKLRGLVAYYEQFQSGSSGTLQTEFFYYDRVKQDSGDYALEEKGTLDLTRTGTLYSDGYAFLSLSRLHQEGEAVGARVTLKVDIGGAADLAGMTQYDATYLGAFNADLTPFVEKWDGTQPFYYAYGLPNAALDVAAADSYFLQLKVAGMDSEAELDSLWINPHFGRTAFNGYGETNPKDGSPKVSVPNATSGTIAIRSIRQFNNMRKYSSSIRDWKQELDIDAAQYQGHPEQDGEGYLTLGGLRVVTQQDDGSWAPVACSAQPTAADIPANYRLAMDSITMHSQDADKDGWGGAYDGDGHTISGLSIGSVTEVTKSNPKRYYAGLFSHNKGTLKNIVLTDSAVTGETGSDNNFTGGLAGYTEGEIFNCAVKNCTVTQTGTGKKSNVGGLVGYVRKGTVGLDGSAAAPCAVVNCLVDGGSATYTGGFTGYVRDGSLQNCGVRIEAISGTLAQTADQLYETQTVKGGGTVGGFTGGMEDGTVQYSHASVKVEGGVAGGFAGMLKGGVIHNCYAAGHTKNHTYVAGIGNANVDGSRAGGFVCDWSGGDITGVCYTTCSVNAPATSSDVDLVGAFARSFPSGNTLPDCYASGFVYVAGVRKSTLEGSGALGLGSKDLTGAPAVAQPYDSTLPKQYTNEPTTDAAGVPMTHYGDWQYKASRTGFEWEPIPEEFSSVDRGEALQSAEADWNGNVLSLNFTTIGYGTNLASIFAPSGGHFAITTDLGYVATYLVESIDGVSVRITDGNGNTWEITPEVVGYTEDWQPIRSYTVTIPTSSLPPYLKTVNVGGYKEGYLVSDISNTDTSASDYAPVEEFLPGDSVTIDGSFDDWVGYPHQLLAFTPGNAATSGSAMGAAFGDGNDIYVHVVNEYSPNLVDPDFSGTLVNIPVTNFSVSVVGDDSWNSRDYEWWRFTSLTYTGPGVYKLVSWQGVEYMECYLIVRDDGSQELEMLFHLDAMTGSKETADQISDFTISFGTIAGSLTIRRDLSEE